MRFDVLSPTIMRMCLPMSSGNYTTSPTAEPSVAVSRLRRSLSSGSSQVEESMPAAYAPSTASRNTSRPGWGPGRAPGPPPRGPAHPQRALARARGDAPTAGGHRAWPRSGAGAPYRAATGPRARRLAPGPAARSGRRPAPLPAGCRPAGPARAAPGRARRSQQAGGQPEDQGAPPPQAAHGHHRQTGPVYSPREG